MNPNYEKLKAKLLELFMLDQPDLDFGIFRIMNSKRQEITCFLDNDLLPQVRQAFAQYRESDKAHIEAELQEATAQAKALGVDPDTSTRVQELKAKLAASVDLTALENEVYSDLYNFFRRYYKDGDFLSLRRYKEGVYAIPYEGEEVKLYWANHDQYYIKTTEYFRDYAFTLPHGRRVHFKIVEADVEKDNRKADTNNERRFILAADQPVVEQAGELVIRFNYLPCDKKTSQKDLNQQAVAAVFAAQAIDAWIPALSTNAPTEKNPNRTLLEKHLTDYTARNTFDYFIHKDLGGFLRRELDFYIKNEIMRLDDIASAEAPAVESYLARIKVLRHIAGKLIDFLAQLEDFQKKLWLKKKFVVETNYCITLDRVPEVLYPEIAANDAQREEWVRLFAIDEIQATEGDLVHDGSPAYSEPLTVAFLKANPSLLLDTRYFTKDFTDKLISLFDDLDAQLRGLLIQSDNFHALNLLHGRYANQIKLAYIDPPYNTGDDGFPYKDTYQHSSWISLLYDRVALAKTLLSPAGSHFTCIGDDEAGNLRVLLDAIFARPSIPFIWKSRAKPTNAGEAKYRPQIVGEFVLQNQLQDTLTYAPLPSGETRKYPHADAYGNYRTTTILTSNLGRYRRETMRFEIAGYTPPPDKRWKAGPDEIQALYDNQRIGFSDDGEPNRKHYEGDEDEQHLPLWTFLPEDVTGTAESGKNDLSAILGSAHGLDSVKPKELTMIFLNALAGPNDIVIDYFCGSGTTAHAVLELNREDQATRKYILIELANYFHTLLKPRLQRVIYTDGWRDGKPAHRANGISHMFKYIRLESYEDCLNNLIMRRSDAQQTLLDSNPHFRDSYMLGYMLDTEATGSASLLNIDAFEDPFNYTLNIAAGSVGETRPVTVDLVETFNYLLGLRVQHIDTIRGYRVVVGYNPKDEKVLVIWRNTREKSNADLEEFFTRQQYNTLDMEFHLIYVNGDNNLENLRKDEETWKVRLIEEEFQRLMFDVQDV